MNTTTLGCPDWCTLAPERHELGIVADNGDRAVYDHDGPRWGGFFATGVTYLGADDCDILLYGPPDLEDTAMSVESLRQLAHDALAAADWLEAHQPRA